MRSMPLLILGALAAYAAGQSIPKTMAAVKANTTPGCGTPFTCVVEVTADTPGVIPGTILVRVNSSSVNPSDVDAEVAVGSVFGILGIDFAGTVVKVGPLVKDFKVGDQVWGMTKGAYAQYAFAVEATTALVPKNIPLREAGTIPEVGMTSLSALEKLGAPWNVSDNKTVVITSGSGGTGFMAIQLAKALGAGTIITATSGEANIAFVKSIGADIVVDYKVQEVFDALSNNSVDFVFDNYGAPGTADRAMRTIRSGGIFELLPGGEKGKLSKHPKPGVKQIDFGDLIPKRSYLNTMAPLFEAGKLVTHIDSTFELRNTAQAFARSKTGEVVGKVAITMPV